MWNGSTNKSVSLIQEGLLVSTLTNSCGPPPQMGLTDSEYSVRL